MNAEVQSPYKIKQASLDDVPFILALAQELYPNRSVERGVPWIKHAIGNPRCFVVVGPNSAGLCHITNHYGCEPRARLDALACRPTAGNAFESLKMLRVMLWWAKTQGCKGTFRLDADTGVDFAPFAARLGGKRIEAVRYEIPL